MRPPPHVPIAALLGIRPGITPPPPPPPPRPAPIVRPPIHPLIRPIVPIVRPVIEALHPVIPRLRLPRPRPVPVVPPVVVLKPAIAIPPIKHPLVERIAEMERETGRLGELIREREERLRGLESAIVRLSAEADSLRAINTRLEKDAQRTSTELVTADATLRRNREGMRHFQDLFGLFVRQGILEKIA